MSISKTFCPLPWNHLCTTSSGTYRLCCSSDEQLNKIKNSEGGNLKIYKDSFSNIRNESLLNSVRKEMMENNKPLACSPCFDLEERGLRSPRQSYLSSYSSVIEQARAKTGDAGEINHDDFPVQYIDIRLGNLCNLRCRMCNSWSSSSWNEESKVIFNSPEVGLLDWPNKKKQWVQEVLAHSNLQELYLTGGEPTLIEENIRLLKEFKKLGLNNIRVKINSNLTSLSKSLTETLLDFQKVLFKCSVDGLEGVNDYIRFPSRFSEIKENLMFVKDHFEIEVQTTVQSYNIFSLGEWTVWCLDNLGIRPDLYLLEDPHWLNIMKMNPRYKEVAKACNEKYMKALSQSDQEELSRILSLVSSNFSEESEKEFHKYTKAMDQYRGQSIKDYIPEFK